jgi:hypothetical protein
MHGPIPWVRGPAALSVHPGPKQWSGGGLAKARARGRFGEWELTVSWGKGRGAPRGPHRGYKRVAQWRIRPGDGEWRRRWTVVRGHVLWSREGRKE